jgi:hypothetical protein
MITYEEKESGKPGERVEEIKFHGLTIGEMITYFEPYTRFHACFHSRRNTTRLIQGHGDTRENAMREAIASARREAESLIKEAGELERILSVCL